jgi:hypothetical protein
MMLSFDPAEYKETVIVDTKETVTRVAPGMRLKPKLFHC